MIKIQYGCKHTSLQPETKDGFSLKEPRKLIKNEKLCDLCDGIMKAKKANALGGRSKQWR